MKKWTICTAILTGLCFAAPVNSYEVETHALLTYTAFGQSSLSSPDWLRRLGIDRFIGAGIANKLPPFDKYYMDSFDLSASPRHENEYEATRIEAVKKANDSLTTPGWLMRGAIREDDNPAEFPQDDPDVQGAFHREFNHFYDPQKSRPLERTGIGAFYALYTHGIRTIRRAPDWAAGTDDIFVNANLRGTDTLNNFTVPQAREAMFRSLTLKKRSVDGSVADLYSAPQTPAISEFARKIWTATMFRALGNVLHLNQDMAQPQHTRNEAHSGLGGPFQNNFSGHTSVYEKYLQARSRGLPFVIDGNVERPYGALPFDPYPVPRFASYQDYWSTANGIDGSAPSGKGLADYSSRGFLTNANNIDGSEYVAPPTTPSSYVSVLSDYSPDPTSNVKVRQLTISVPDGLVGPSPAIQMVTESMWSGFFGGGSNYALTRVNYDDHASLLIPRAVAYSAGLIDYFFRGQLEITPPDEGVYALIDHYDFAGFGKNPTDATTGFKGFKAIKLKLRNATPDIVPSGGGAAVPQIMPGGQLYGVLKFFRNKNYTDDLAGEPLDNSGYASSRSAAEEIVVSARVKDGSGTVLSAPIGVTNSAQTFVFEFDQELPINAIDVQLQVVYRGTLGNESDAVVVETIDISEPTYFTYMNATDYIKIGSSVYTRAEIDAATPDGAMLRSQVSPPACVDSATNQLKTTCFQPFPIAFPIKFGGAAAASGNVNLPIERTFHRLAMLAPADANVSIIQSTSPCLPNSAVTFTGEVLQTNYGAGGAGPIDQKVRTLPSPVRGVRGWYTVACVNNGDASPPGSIPDDRLTKMAPLSGSNLNPQQLPNFTFGAP